MNPFGFIVLDKRPEPKEEAPRPLTMYGEDFDIPVSYWQEPVLTEKELFPEKYEEYTQSVKPQSIPVVGTLSTYRSYKNNQF